MFIFIMSTSRNIMKLYRHYINYLEIKFMDIFIDIRKNYIILYHMIFTISVSIIAYLMLDFIGIILAVSASFILPLLLAIELKRGYDKRFIRQLPDTMSSLSAMLRAGTHLTKAMHLVAEQHTPPISQEFMIVLSEYKMGRNLNEALSHMSKRIDRQEVELLVSSIAISNRVGGNLASNLDILSETLREKITIEGKIDALTSMGRMQGKVINFIPVGVFFVLYLQDPAGMQLLFQEPIGWLTMSILLLLMIIASLIIRKITHISI